jgi:Icc protein
MPIILQLTDPHFRANNDRINGIPPRESLETVLEAARRYCPEPDCVVWTGDIADDGSTESYQCIREVVGDWFDRSLWLPGNHDSRAGMRSKLLDQDAETEALISFSACIEGWRLLGFDTQITGSTPGELRLSQWERLKQTTNGEPILLFLHHPPATIECEWADKISLVNRDTFDELLFETSSICATFSGHVHSAYEGNHSGVRICTTPSTLFQFDLSSSTITVDSVAPGFRAIHLDGSTMRTEVIRLPELVYPPQG